MTEQQIAREESIPPAVEASRTKHVILPCCMRTVDQLAHINSMMVCRECKQIIKAFREESPYRNYLKFCQGRSRILSTGIYGHLWLVVFYAYDA